MASRSACRWPCTNPCCCNKSQRRRPERTGPSLAVRTNPGAAPLQTDTRSALTYGLINRLAVFALLVALAFALPRLMPGDPLDVLLSEDVSRELTAPEIADLREQMGLSGSPARQFARYLAALAQGDLGYSHRHAAPVSDLLARALPWTALLFLGATPIFLLGGLLAGTMAGRRPHGPADRIATAAITLLASIPPFVAALGLLLAFGILWPVLPVSGAEPLFPSDNPLTRAADIARHAVLPCLALAAHEIVRIFLLARGEAASISHRPFLTNARARGIAGWRLWLNYYGRNMLPVVLARLSDSVTALVGVVLYVEIVFAYPGIGHLIYDAILDRDYMLLQGAVIGLAVFVLVLNGLIDLAVTLLAERG